MNDFKRLDFVKLISAEAVSAVEKHGNAKWGRHEFYGILKEEVDELWEAIKKNHSQEKLEEELIQVAAVCLRYFATGDRRWGDFNGGTHEMDNLNR